MSDDATTPPQPGTEALPTVPPTGLAAPDLPGSESGPPTAPAAPRLEHYDILTQADGLLWELGRGAMGVTYKALDTRLHCHVALKVINADLLARHPEARERFLREARAAARLRHPNVASVFHLGETAAGQAFYAMEFIEGETLEARVRRRGPLSVPLVLELGIEVARALVAASQQGLIHRDLKPANLMLVAGADETVAGNSGNSAGPGVGSSHPSEVGEARVKVIDFGLAKATDTGPLTNAGDFLGTPQFASPEQFADSDHDADARSDIYSLGVTLWYALTGKLPFPGKSLSEIRSRQLSQRLPSTQLSAAQVPAPVAALLASMLSANPAARPQTPHALLDALRRCRATVAPPLPASSGGPAAAAASRHAASLPLVASLVGLAAVVIGVGSFFLQPERKIPPTPAPPARSIAVLPFQNLSEEKANAFFASGIQVEIVTALAKISGLKVTSRTSTARYQSSPADLSEIARTLGVANILEGSVQRVGDKVHINVQLIRADTDAHLWAQSYDRQLADIFSVEAEVARSIAESLRMALSPEEKARMEAKPTENGDAYVLYLRARESQTSAAGLLGDYTNAARLYTEAIKLDPGFALARARLSATLAFLYQEFQPTPAHRDRARAEAEEALQLQPDLGEGHLARALCLYWLDKAYDAALGELAVAGRLLPNDSDVESTVAYIHRRRGRWNEARAGLQGVLTRDPRNGQIAEELSFTDYKLRDWPAAIRSGDRAVALAPELPSVLIFRRYVDFWSRGDLEPLRTALAAIPPGVDPDGAVTLARWDSALLARDFATAERVVANYPLERLQMFIGPPLPKSYLLGSIALARGEPARARSLFEQALPALAAEAEASPDDPFRHASLGLLFSYLGRNDDALREGRRAVALRSEANDALDGPNVAALWAMIQARTGQTAGALTLIERLLVTPSGVDIFEASITLPDLRNRWQWDPLRQDPRFQALVAKMPPQGAHR